jgi:hypothetical protein
VKKFLLITLVLYAAGFAATALAHATGYLRFNAFTGLALATAIIVAAIVPLAFSDYRRRPLARADRAASKGNSDETLAVSLRPWTYQTHGTSS